MNPSGGRPLQHCGAELSKRQDYVNSGRTQLFYAGVVDWIKIELDRAT
jgi:hypothetical protein